MRIVPVLAGSTTEAISNSQEVALYNPSYEGAVNAAVPDGNYPGLQGVDQAASFFQESRFASDGRHSLRLHSVMGRGKDDPAGSNYPKADGYHLAPYKFDTTSAAFQVNATYDLTFDMRTACGVSSPNTTVEVVVGTWAKVLSAETSGDTVSVVVAAGVPSTIWHMNQEDPASIGDQSCGLWQRHTLSLVALNDAIGTGWLSYGLVTAGDVWLDNMRLVKVAKLVQDEEMLFL